jgi:hypothetical protein
MITKCNTDKKEVDYWSTEKTEVSQCSRVDKHIIVKMSLLVKLKIEMLMAKYTNREWLAYLIGDKETNYIKDLYFPKQIATSASVRPLEFIQNKDLIGVIHSHHNMGHSFSGTDDEFINKNHDLSIVISNSGYSGQAKGTTPCGYNITLPIKIETDYGVDLDRDDFLNHVESKLVEPEPVVKKVTASNEDFLPFSRRPFTRRYTSFKDLEKDILDEVDISEEQIERLIEEEVRKGYK